MPGGWATPIGLSNGNDQGTNLSSSATTQVTSGAVNTKGSYSQIVASTPYDCSWMLVTLEAGAGASVGYAVDIAVGSAGSEVPVISNLYLNYLPSATNNILMMLPISIPAGSRISARAAAVAATKHVFVSVILFDSDFPDVSDVSFYDSIGFVSGSTCGTPLTPGVNAKGAFTTLISSTPYDYSGFAMNFDNQNTNGSTSPVYMLLDIAIGPAGSEQVVLPNVALAIKSSTASNVSPPNSPFFSIPICAGTRISARAAWSATGQNFGLSLVAARA